MRRLPLRKLDRYRNLGLLVAEGGAGAELDLALIAAMAAVATCGPGTLSVDRNTGLEGRPV